MTLLAAHLLAYVLLPSPLQVVFLGTGTPQQNPDRSGPAAAVVVGGESYLIDCGPGVVRRAAAAARKGIPELAPPKLCRLFITHLHSDHTLGYPDLIFSPWVVGRTSHLAAYGPKGLALMTKYLELAYGEDIQVRTTGLEHGNRTGYHVDVREVTSGKPYDGEQIYRDANVTVTAFEVNHGSWEHALGYKFESGGKSIVFSGDTAPCAQLERMAQGADVLVHEVYPLAAAAPEKRPGGEDWPKYMKAFHTSTLELGAIAARCHPKLLVLTHVVGRVDEAVLKEEIRRGGFDGEVRVVSDLESVIP